MEHYTAALSINVQSRYFTAVCLCNRAAAYQALGQIADAIADCNLAIVLDEKYSKVGFYMLVEYAVAWSLIVEFKLFLVHLNLVLVEEIG